MKHLLITLSLTVLFLTANLFAQDSSRTQTKNQNTYKHQTKTAVKVQTKGTHGIGFVDENGDGYNDNARDDDGDGIPNGMDEDYAGAKARKGNAAKGFVDMDGDGINDNAMDEDGDGIPNGQDPDFVRPNDGQGKGASKGKNSRNALKGESNGGSLGSGTGDCDGTGPKGKGNRGGKK